MIPRNVGPTADRPFSPDSEKIKGKLKDCGARNQTVPRQMILKTHPKAYWST